MNYVMRLFRQDIGVLWYPFILLIILLFLMLLLHLWGKKFFRSDFNSETDQVKPYNSGNLDAVNYNIKSSNLYWGFKKTLEKYFKFMGGLHNGDLNDYMKWLIIFTAICFLLVGAGML